MTESKVSRRQVLLATGTAALVGLVATDVSVATLVEKRPLAFFDRLLSAEERAIGQRELAPYQPKVLALDLIWEWRGELHARIARGADVIAITRWDKALLLKYLAREASFPIRQHRIAKSLFRTEISRGSHA